jgi:hypothetical protein
MMEQKIIPYSFGDLVKIAHDRLKEDTTFAKSCTKIQAGNWCSIHESNYSCISHDHHCFYCCNEKQRIKKSISNEHDNFMSSNKTENSHIHEAKEQIGIYSSYDALFNYLNIIFVGIYVCKECNEIFIFNDRKFEECSCTPSKNSIIHFFDQRKQKCNLHHDPNLIKCL